MKNIIKLLYLKIKLYKVNYKNLKADTYLGRYSIFRSDKSSNIFFNEHNYFHSYVTVIAEDYGKIILGKRVSIGDYSTIRASRATIEIGSNTMIAQSVKLISTNHQYRDKNLLICEQDVDLNKIGLKIGDDCWLGAGCVILPGVTIGNGVVVGANAVVTKNVPDYAVIVGSPAKVISFRY